MLVPGALRQSQTRFKFLVDLSLQAAGLQAEVTSLSDQYRKLRAEKDRLMEDRADVDSDKEVLE